jgi:drug/metabolite transporter (DMT)-like permease
MIGASAVLVWSTLAVLTAASVRVPPFQLLATAFAVSILLGFGKALLNGTPLWRLRLPASACALGIGGLFGNHFCYFMALRHAPPADANLINYLWPLLIVLCSAFYPGHRLRWWHVLGALSGLAGTALVITGGGTLTFRGEFAFGYLMAVGAALTWAGYSLLSRRFAAVPSDAVTLYCGATALLAVACHLALETWVRPSTNEWLMMLALGLGPVGTAFFLWDHGVKRGDLRVLGAAAYAIPLLSTTLLVLAGFARPTAVLALAALLITAGAILASRDLWSRHASPRGA